MAERDSFMPGACTTAANREVFKCLDAGRRNEAVIHAAQQVCMTTCVQFNACEAQSDVITLELQKSGVEATVVAGKYVQPFSLSQDILASTEMFKAPVVTWEKVRCRKAQTGLCRPYGSPLALGSLGGE